MAADGHSRLEAAFAGYRTGPPGSCQSFRSRSMQGEGRADDVFLKTSRRYNRGAALGAIRIAQQIFGKAAELKRPGLKAAAGHPFGRLNIHVSLTSGPDGGTGLL
jgi:hypothetical protein